MDKLLEQKLEQYWEDPSPHNLPEYKQAKLKLNEMLKKVQNLLPESERKLFNDLTDLTYDPEHVATEYAFKSGFKAGLKFHLEMEKWVKM